MAEYQNNISKLIDKIERRLGLLALTPHLPDSMNKNVWGDIIKEDSLLTYSRYLPRKFSFKVTDDSAPYKDGWYYLNEDLVGETTILGVGDIDWQTFNQNSAGLAYGYGAMDSGLSMNFTYQDIIDMKNKVDYSSLFCNQVIPEFSPPNKIRLVAVGNQNVRLRNFNIILYLKHLDSLVSIPPTAMEKFEQLCQADIAAFLSSNLKYWDGIETVFATIDLKLSYLENEASKRDNVIDYLEQSYISAGNRAIPLMMTV
nr:MAG TPA: hypothetical protein [Caudoviricetes sp.]